MSNSIAAQPYFSWQQCFSWKTLFNKSFSSLMASWCRAAPWLAQLQHPVSRIYKSEIASRQRATNNTEKRQITDIIPPGHNPPGHNPPGHNPTWTQPHLDTTHLDTTHLDTTPPGHNPPGQNPTWTQHTWTQPTWTQPHLDTTPPGRNVTSGRTKSNQTTKLLRNKPLRIYKRSICGFRRFWV